MSRAEKDSRAAVRKSHEPGLCGAWLPFDVSDTYAEGETFKGF
jgi:hypothetical protein